MDQEDRRALLAPYTAAGLTLIPLHRHDQVDAEGRKRGKSPRDANWTSRDYTGFDAAAHLSAGGNVGVRLTAQDLVVDVDPRNFPDGETLQTDNPLHRLCRDVGMDLDGFPTVVTGSGGMHIYMRKAADVSLVDSRADYPGVEFKSRGRQVVAAGSVHPDTKAAYEWDALCLPLVADGAPDAPIALVEIARRPVAAAPTGGGEYGQEELAAMLGRLDPEDFRDQDRWLQLMMACHHATAGDGRQEFIDWSTGDALFTDHAAVIGARWDSLHADASGSRVTFRTLHKLLIDAGAGDAIPRAPAAEDFAEVSEEDTEITGLKATEGEADGEPVKQIVDAFNRDHCAVLYDGSFSIFKEEVDPVFGDRRVWTKMTREAFRQYYEDETVRTVGSRRPMSKADLWLSNPRRRKYPGIVMDPQGLPHNVGKLNLWRGWAVQPKPGDWSLMKELIGDILCDGDLEAERYVHMWIAHMLQRPWEAPEVAIAFRGAEGVGKGTLGRALMKIAGPHGLTVAHRTQFTGRFNAHLRDCIFLFADEAVWPGDHESEGTLKQLLTEPVISYEAKGRDIVQGRNMVHVMMASNAEWVVPAGPEARRFFVTDVSPKRRQDQDFFGRLWRQMDQGGLAAMVHDLMSVDLTGWRPASDVPQTAALADQKLRSLRPDARFWLQVLQDGEMPFRLYASGEEVEWRKGPVVLGETERSATVEAFRNFLTSARLMSERATHKAVINGGRLAGLMTGTRARGAERIWTIPPLSEARAEFERKLGVEDLFG